MTRCILKACPWAKTRACMLLDRCGADHALEQSRAPEGYEVVSGVGDNPTIAALANAGLVKVHRYSADTKRYRCVVRAVEAVREAAE